MLSLPKTLLVELGTLLLNGICFCRCLYDNLQPKVVYFGQNKRPYPHLYIIRVCIGILYHHNYMMAQHSDKEDMCRTSLEKLYASVDNRRSRLERSLRTR